MDVLLELVLLLERLAIHHVQYGSGIFSFILTEHLPTVERVEVALTIVSSQLLHSHRKINMLRCSAREALQPIA